MRTVDPRVWSDRIINSKIQGIRNNKFGQQLPHRYEMIFRESLTDAVTEYWENCSMPGVKFINMEDMHKGERFCYIFCFILTVMLGIYVVLTEFHKFCEAPPLVVSQQISEELISEISFPAIAVCSNNIISRKALENYTDYLYNHSKNRNKLHPYNRSKITSNLRKLGALLVMALPRVHNDFEEFLFDVEPMFNVTDIMYQLSPPCASILQRCSWRGRVVACAELFAVRSTALGFCCVFNSRYDPEDVNNKPHMLELTGENYGLGFVMMEDTNDFTYMRRNGYGMEMLIFEGSEYPLLEGGDVQLYPVPSNLSIFANIRTKTQNANENLNFYNEQWRGCRSYGAGQSQCLMQCRRNTAAVLCDCVPFALQAVDHDSRRVCTLRDLACLVKHREKFMYVYPRSAEAEDSDVSEELQGGLDCGQCLVKCARRLHSLDLSYVKYEHYNFYRNPLTEGLRPATNLSVVRVFYSAPRHTQYTLEAHQRWYEIFVKLSAQWMTVGGISVVCGVELMYHCSIRWMHHFIRRTRLAHLRL